MLRELGRIDDTVIATSTRELAYRLQDEFTRIVSLSDQGDSHAFMNDPKVADLVRRAEEVQQLPPVERARAQAERDAERGRRHAGQPRCWLT
ncbi:MAG: hypothetical protein ACXVFQ_01420 [Solirubrobacteraceae bacterium]